MSDIPSTGLRPLNVPAFHFFLYSLFFLGLLSRSPVTRAVIFVPILVSSIYVVLYRSLPQDDASTYSLFFQTVIRSSDVFLINDAAKLKRVGQKRDTNDLPLWDKAKRALDFMFNPRMVGWMDEPRHILPPHPTESRWKFIRSRIAMCACYIAVADVAQTVSWYVPDMNIWQESTIKGYLMKPVCTVLTTSVVWAMVSLVHAMLSIVAVGIGINDASEWPPFFGNWSDAYTVRRFWGRTWHQILRRCISAHGDFVAYHLLHLQKDSFVGTNVHRYVAFFISGIIHVVSEYGILRSKFWEYHTSMRFFLLQATVIMFEQIVGKTVGLKAGKWTRRAGYLWTFWWFSLTYLPWIYPQIRFGTGYQVLIWQSGSFTKLLCTGKWNFETF